MSVEQFDDARGRKFGVCAGDPVEATVEGDPEEVSTLFLLSWFFDCSFFACGELRHGQGYPDYKHFSCRRCC